MSRPIMLKFQERPEIANKEAREMGRNIWWLFLNNEIRHIKSFTRYEVKDEETALIFPKDPPWFKLWMVPVMMLFIFFIVVVILICRRCQNCRRGENSPSIHPISQNT
ncbi:unnamed protein product [Brassica oleracea var. botrytis]